MLSLARRVGYFSHRAILEPAEAVLLAVRDDAVDLVERRVAVRANDDGDRDLVGRADLPAVDLGFGAGHAGLFRRQRLDVLLAAVGLDLAILTDVEDQRFQLLGFGRNGRAEDGELD